MGWIDLVPRAGNLYIGGFSAVYQTDLIRAANITHVLSVINPELLEHDGPLLKTFRHLVIPVEDDPNEDLLKYFEQSNQFIKDGIEGGGGVFVHCAMGKSRSATLVVAYLMATQNVSPTEALAQLCEGRPVCSPNPGFMEQLDVYHLMLQSGSAAERETVYKKWLETRVFLEGWEWDRKSRL